MRSGSRRNWRVAVDTGGTFTDCIFVSDEGEVRRGKVLSSAALRFSIVSVSGSELQVGGMACTIASLVPGCLLCHRGSSIGKVVGASETALHLDTDDHGLQQGDIIEVLTGMEAPVLALRLFLPELARQEAVVSMRLGTTKATNALLERKGARVALMVSSGFEDLLVIKDQKRPDLFARSIQRSPPLYHRVYGIGGTISASGEEVLSLDESALLSCARDALASGCEAVALCLKNSCHNPLHEVRALALLSEMGFKSLHASVSLTSRMHYQKRAETVLVNAMLDPLLGSYLDAVEAALDGTALKVMTSSGGLVDRCRFNAIDSLVSGPAGGVAGAVALARQTGATKILSLDMGGTSADVCRWNGETILRPSVTVGSATVFSPALHIETVAAGGGSICCYADGALKVGPDSAGAYPGPASYGGGGPLTLTDVHWLMGRIDEARFGVPLDIRAAESALSRVVTASGMQDWKQVCLGMIQIATERMAQAIREVSAREGEDPSHYTLVVFGGAGGLHACGIAEELGIHDILFARDAGLLSARGILDSAVEAIAGKEVLLPIEHLRDEEITDWFAQLNHEALGAARAMSEGQACQVVESVLELRLSGQEHPLTVVWQGSLASVRTAFAHQFRQVFGYFPKSAKLEVVRLRARARSVETTSAVEAFLIERDAKALRFAETYCRGQWCSVPVYEREHLRSGDSFEGPALVSDLYGTLFIEPGWRCVCGSLGTLRLGLSSKPQFSEKLKNQSQPAAVRRALLRNRLEAIVTEMGVQLQRTALSTNIRERMDFSCGLLDDAGRLLLNAPHIPVHLGALGECVRVVLERFDFGPGDVLITNHPAYGGSHLPDVTVICGVFDDQGTLLAYLANRAHHAEIGGISPGSMPVGAENLAQEGVVIAPRWLIKDGKDYFDELEAVLRNAPHPSRNPVENLIDLEAQVASLRRGIFLFEKLLQGISSEELCAFFDFLYQSSRRALWNKLQNSGSVDRSIVQVMDDGSELCVRVRFGLDGCSFDFSGTRNEHPGNLNATPAIVRSVLLYVLRMWVECDLPLNEGLLEGVDIILPHCMLNPVFSENTLDCPAVVGGNTETSQQLTDALLRALEMLAGSQATMNNFLFGNERSGYYETIGGGAGAGPGFDGCSGVHVHMTNTAITDVEVLEHRYPVRCHRFAVRPDSGGCGRYRGGDGLVREIEFLSPLQVSLLTQTRARGAAGLCGGDDGKPGRQMLIKQQTGKAESLPASVTFSVISGDRLVIETPGGAGWGAPTTA